MTDKPTKPADSLEPEAQHLYNGSPDRAIQLSQAISLKRMADVAARGPSVQTVRVHGVDRDVSEFDR